MPTTLVLNVEMFLDLNELEMNDDVLIQPEEPCFICGKTWTPWGAACKDCAGEQVEFVDAITGEPWTP